MDRLASMGAPVRHRFEFRLNLNTGGSRTGSALPDAMKYRLDRELRRRGEMLGLRVYDVRVEMSRIVMEALVQPNMVIGNVERSLWGAINGLLQREMPHLVKRTGKGRGPSRQTGFFY